MATIPCSNAVRKLVKAPLCFAVRCSCFESVVGVGSQRRNCRGVCWNHPAATLVAEEAAGRGTVAVVVVVVVVVHKLSVANACLQCQPVSFYMLRLGRKRLKFTTHEIQSAPFKALSIAGIAFSSIPMGSTSE